ncbi:hypothetical protein [Bacillus sp. 7894-2]|uniref:hypothetical protein n=1 Tax=Bacillus sp. 7894-2 TaxID=2021695 RepID=UPI000BA69AFB|nr:hypothetical protein [Bacillus sp. 7894-2]PAE24076.1 hypothetical protein CHI10_14840 [Bacillus sp. 7894-2]
MVKYRIEFDDGIKNVKRNVGRRGAKKLRKRLELALEEGTHAMADRAADYSPKDTTALMHSILASVEREAPLTYYFGSTMPYAQRQEYEHKTKRYYFRRAIRKEQPHLWGRFEDIVKDQFKG